MDVLPISIRLLRHQWLSSFRSVVRPQNIAGTVILSVLLLVLALNLLSLGLMLEGFLATAGPGVDPVAIVNGVLLYYLLLDLLLRLWFQRIPGQIVRPYLILPVPRAMLAHLLLAKSFFSLFNALPLLVLIPVALRIVAPLRGVEAAAGWLLALVGLLLCNGITILYVKKRELVNPWWGAGVLVLLALVAALDFTDVLSLRAVSVVVFGTVLEEPWWGLLPLVILGALYRASDSLLLGHITVENLREPGASVGGRMSFRGLEASGTTGRLIALELKMLLRNRRPRAMTVFAGAMIPFLIGFEAYWLAQMPEREEIYPVPDSLALLQAAAEEASVPAGPHLNRVTFSVRPRSLPEGTWVHLTGNLSALGEWDPGAVPLMPQEDGTWRRTVLVPSDTLIECRVTLGSWDAQRLLADGSRPANTHLLVEHDTTLTIAADRWRHPEIFILITVNMIYIGILLSGMFLISYGQLLLGWDGSYLEGILARPVSLSRYLAAKHALLVGSVFVLSVLTLPLGLLKPWFLPANGALTLYNAGVNAPLLLMMAQFSRRPVDLNASLFSMQGKGSVQILLLAPVLVGPILVYACCALLGNEGLTFWVLGGLGLLGLVLYRPLLRRTVRMILQRKHSIVAAYRLV